jgi:hypothetical protein
VIDADRPLPYDLWVLGMHAILGACCDGMVTGCV